MSSNCYFYRHRQHVSRCTFVKLRRNKQPEREDALEFPIRGFLPKILEKVAAHGHDFPNYQFRHHVTFFWRCEPFEFYCAFNSGYAVFMSFGLLVAFQPSASEFQIVIERCSSLAPKVNKWLFPLELSDISPLYSHPSQASRYHVCGLIWKVPSLYCRALGNTNIFFLGPAFPGPCSTFVPLPACMMRSTISDKV